MHTMTYVWNFMVVLFVTVPKIVQYRCLSAGKGVLLIYMWWFDACVCVYIYIHTHMHQIITYISKGPLCLLIDICIVLFWGLLQIKLPWSFTHRSLYAHILSFFLGEYMGVDYIGVGIKIAQSFCEIARQYYEKLNISTTLAKHF